MKGGDGSTKPLLPKPRSSYDQEKSKVALAAAAAAASTTSTTSNAASSGFSNGGMPSKGVSSTTPRNQAAAGGNSSKRVMANVNQMANWEEQIKFGKQRKERILAEEAARIASEKAAKDEEERLKQVAEETMRKAEEVARRTKVEQQNEDERRAREQEEQRRKERLAIEKNKRDAQQLIRNDKLGSMTAAVLLTFGDFMLVDDIDEVGAWTDVEYVYGSDKQLYDFMLSGKLENGLMFPNVVAEGSEALKNLDLEFKKLSGISSINLPSIH